MRVVFQQKESRRERFEVIVDEEKWREVHRSIFGRKPALPATSLESDLEQLQQLFDTYEYTRVRGYVLWRLSMQSYHSEQLIKLLKERLVQSHTIDRIINDCRSMGFLDDEVWLESFIRTHQKRSSHRSILNKLRMKGISSETLMQLALEERNPEGELLAIRHLIQTRYRSKDLHDFKIRQKVLASLARKGYAIENIRMVFKECLES